MLLEHKLKEYHQKGDVRQINLITDAKWHRSWKPNMLQAVSLYVCNRSLGGITFACMYSIKTYLSENQKITNVVQKYLYLKRKFQL